MLYMIFALVGVCGVSSSEQMPARGLVTMTVHGDEVNTASRWRIVLHCAIERPARPPKQCSGMVWTHVDVSHDGRHDDAYGEDDKGGSSNEGQASLVVDEKDTYRICTDLSALTSHLHILRAEEELKGRYSCILVCGSRAFTTDCDVTDFLLHNRTFLCSEKTLDDFFGAEASLSSTLGTDRRHNADDSDDTPRSSSGSELEAWRRDGQVIELHAGRNDSGKGRVLSRPTAVHVLMGTVAIVLCIAGIIAVMLLRGCAKHKMKSERTSRGGEACSAQTRRHQEQRQPQPAQRERRLPRSQGWEQRWGERSEREIRSYIAFSRSLSLSERSQFPLSSPDSSRRFWRSSVVVTTAMSGPLSGRQRHGLLGQRPRDGDGYGRAASCCVDDDSVSISIPEVWGSPRSSPFSAGVRLPPSYHEAMTQSRQEPGGRLDDIHLPANEQTELSEEQQRPLLPEEEHPRQRQEASPSSRLQPHHFHYHRVRAPPPPYRTGGESLGEARLTASWDQLYDASALEDVGDVSRPPSYQSLQLDTETDEVCAIHLQKNPSFRSIEDSHSEDSDSQYLDSEDDTHQSVEGPLPPGSHGADNGLHITDARFSTRGEHVYFHLPNYDDSFGYLRSERDMPSHASTHQSGRDVPEEEGRGRQTHWPMGRPPPAYDESVQL